MKTRGFGTGRFETRTRCDFPGCGKVMASARGLELVGDTRMGARFVVHACKPDHILSAQVRALCEGGRNIELRGMDGDALRDARTQLASLAVNLHAVALMSVDDFFAGDSR